MHTRALSPHLVEFNAQDAGDLHAQGPSEPAWPPVTSSIHKDLEGHAKLEAHPELLRPLDFARRDQEATPSRIETLKRACEELHHTIHHTR